MAPSLKTSTREDTTTTITGTRMGTRTAAGTLKSDKLTETLYRRSHETRKFKKEIKTFSENFFKQFLQYDLGFCKFNFLGKL
jgi:hypothetical protein